MVLKIKKKIFRYHKPGVMKMNRMDIDKLDENELVFLGLKNTVEKIAHYVNNGEIKEAMKNLWAFSEGREFGEQMKKDSFGFSKQLVSEGLKIIVDKVKGIFTSVIKPTSKEDIINEMLKEGLQANRSVIKDFVKNMSSEMMHEFEEIPTGGAVFKETESVEGNIDQQEKDTLEQNKDDTSNFSAQVRPRKP